MPIYVCDVNAAFREKLVPITLRIVTSIEPASMENLLKRVGVVPENGPLREHEVKDIQLMMKVSPG